MMELDRNSGSIAEMADVAPERLPGSDWAVRGGRAATTLTVASV